MRILFLSLLLVFLFSCNQGKDSKFVVKTKKAPEAIGPYSQGVMNGNTLYLSGQIAINPETGEMLNSSIEAETTQVMENLKAVLKKADMRFSNVLNVTVYLSDLNDFEKFNEVYATYFKSGFPARATVEVAKLPKNARIEIAMIAKK